MATLQEMVVRDARSGQEDVLARRPGRYDSFVLTLLDGRKKPRVWVQSELVPISRSKVLSWAARDYAAVQITDSGT